MLTILTAVIVGTGCAIGLYAVVHATEHKDQASLVLTSAGSLIQTLTFLLAPVIGGIWIALGLRKRANDDPTVTTTQVTTTGPAAAAPSVAVTPAPTMSPVDQ